MRGVCSPVYGLLWLLVLASCGKESRVRDLSLGDDRLGAGVWFVMVHRKECSGCSALRSVLEAAAPRYKVSVSFGALQVGDDGAAGGSWHGLEKGATRALLLLYPGQGKDRFVQCTEEQSKEGVHAYLSHFLAEQALKQGQHDPALKHLQHALKHRPDSVMLNYYAASIYHEHKRELEAAVRHYDVALADDSQLPNPARAHYMAGNAYLTLGYPERAAQCYARATSHDASMHGAHREAAIAYGMQGRVDEAEGHLREALARSPADSDCLTELAALILGRVLEARQQRGGNAPVERTGKKGKRKGKKKGKKKGKGSKDSGKSGRGTGEGEEALGEARDLLLAATRASAGHSEAWFHLGSVYKVQGRLREAQEAFRRAISLREAALPGADGKGRPPQLDGTDMFAGNLSVYVYDLPPKWNSGLLALNMQQCRYSIYASEVYVHEQLLASNRLSLDPSEADIFFVPFYSSCYMASNFVKPGPGWPDNDVDIGKTYGASQSVLEYIKGAHDFWSGKAGSDHVWVFSSDWGSCLAPFSELHNSIHVVTSGDRTELRPSWYQARATHHMGSSADFAERCKLPCFQVHKDIVIPPMLSVPALFRHSRGVGAQVRDIKVYFRGTTTGSHKAMPFAKDYSLGVRQHIVANFSREPGWLISGESKPEAYHQEVRRSELCLAPAGWELWSVRLYEALLHGCVPVILTDGLHLPFEDQIDYSRVAIRVPERDVARLPEVLGGVSAERVSSKREAIRDMWRAITFQRPPEEGDAYHLLLEELSRRVSRGGTPPGSWL